MVRSVGSRVNIALCFMAAILEGFDIQAIGVAAPRLAPELHLGPDKMSWVFFATNLAQVLGAAVSGWVADRVGRKPVIVGAVAGFGAATLATAYVFDYESLLAVRALCGFAFGSALPIMMAMAADISRPDRRALTASAMFCGMPLGGGTVALFTQYLPPDFDWRVLFLVGGFAPIVLTLLLLVMLRETREAAEERGSMVNALFGEGRAVPSLLLWLAFLPTVMILYLILYWLPTLVVAKGFSKAVAPQSAVAFNYASVVGAFIFGWFVDKVGARWPLAIAYAALISVVVLLAQSNDIAMIVALSGAAGFFLLGANYALYGIAASYYPASMRGRGSGAAIGFGRVGAIIGPTLPGLLLAGGAGPNEIIKLMIPAAAIAGIAVFVVSFFPHRN